MVKLKRPKKLKWPKWVYRRVMDYEATKDEHLTEIKDHIAKKDAAKVKAKARKAKETSSKQAQKRG